MLFRSCKRKKVICTWDRKLEKDSHDSGELQSGAFLKWLICIEGDTFNLFTGKMNSYTNPVLFYIMQEVNLV